MEKHVKFLADRDIIEQLTHGVGFSPTENKWYGWSHRAIYGFTIGSTCKKGDCHYRPFDEADELDSALLFWKDENKTYLAAKRIAWNRFLVFWIYDHKVKNKSLHGRMSEVRHYFDPNNLGRGEWTAQTMEDARQMAIDFNKGVS